MEIVEFLEARIAEDEAGANLPGSESRLLREVEAKRAIIGRHAPGSTTDGGRRECEGCVNYWPCADLRALASVYSDHPGHREEWRPSDFPPGHCPDNEAHEEHPWMWAPCGRTTWCSGDPAPKAGPATGSPLLAALAEADRRVALQGEPDHDGSMYDPAFWAEVVDFLTPFRAASDAERADRP